MTASPPIWMYWHQGWDNAPRLVRACRDTWLRLNPDHQLHQLDQHSVREYVRPHPGIAADRPDITVQKWSALARLNLLANHGGVWVDATVACVQPLNTWLDVSSESPFFAFGNPGPDRLMSNWFIAADPASLLAQRLHRDLSNYYATNRFSRQGTEFGDRLIERFNRRWSTAAADTPAWHSWFARKILRVYPYFIFHYTFNRLVLEDPECAAEWQAAQALAAGPPHRIQEWASYPDGIGRAIYDIETRVAPVQKLDWRLDPDAPYWSAVLKHLEAIS